MADVDLRLTRFRRVWWWIVRNSTFLWFRVFYRIKLEGLENRVADGPVLYLPNHQSYLDPIILGCAVGNRPFFSMARKTLWNTPGVAWLITSLNAIPVDQESTDIRSIRACVRVLKAGHAMELFPEGSRTWDGSLQPFAKGVFILIKQARPTVVPVAIDGADDIWLRTWKRPKLFGRIRCRVGKPIPADELIEAGADAAITRIEQAVAEMHSELQKQ